MNIAQGFYAKLKRHLLQRVAADQAHPSPDYDTPGPTSIILQHDRLYQHALLRVNYTTYDVRRLQDVISPSTSHHNIMVLADRGDGEAGHPFAYARVLRVFHVNVLITATTATVDYCPRRMELLWIRWYRLWNPEVDGW